MTLHDDDLYRYARQLILRDMTDAHQERLQSAQVLLVGAGGLGAPALAYMVAAGIGQMTIVDGDTVYLKHNEYGKIKVRLAEIDTPEKDQPYGKEAALALSKLISGKIVKLNKVTVDKYNRIVGIIYYKKTDINYYLVRNGFAWSYDRYNRRKKIKDAENIARKEKIGLWSKQGDPPIPPWEWRKMSKTNE